MGARAYLPEDLAARLRRAQRAPGAHAGRGGGATPMDLAGALPRDRRAHEPPPWPQLERSGDPRRLHAAGLGRSARNGTHVPGPHVRDGDRPLGALLPLRDPPAGRADLLGAAARDRRHRVFRRVEDRPRRGEDGCAGSARGGGRRGEPGVGPGRHRGDGGGWGRDVVATEGRAWPPGRRLRGSRPGGSGAQGGRGDPAGDLRRDGDGRRPRDPRFGLPDPPVDRFRALRRGIRPGGVCCSHTPSASMDG